ncbi:GmrSD restriction endonuclease domain-containing protein [Prevotella pallens]|jgi:hypothetical protein|uniref:Uncharacterized conserved protein n=1 Tax=Prevotella pallens TaxID=60133 RepID=A0A379EZ86_9BACT|nr:DUF262 domain-containing protein [Prevotella pallens]MBF1496366.1 DUF262 domain-containing protein [Prevotella pallens]SUC11665.1 Uncharacterized conserved protein [Prevotella pallens]
MTEKYNASNISLDQILSYIKSGEIAIPEIQRPFVWKPRQVRDLIDSLYKGYPTGYLIISQSPDMKLKDGTLSLGKKIMIDGQQRVTALMTAIAGLKVLTSNFKKRRIKIAFNPQASEESEEEIFKVQDNAILKDKKWIADIAELFKSDFDQWAFVNEYCQQNAEVNGSQMNKILMRLLDIKNRQIGVITLDKDLNIDEVTDIFIRINSQGAKLNQADFAMSKIAANTEYGGNALRKAIDYFSHLAVEPDWYTEMAKDTLFMGTLYASKLKWLKDDQESIFDPDYNDILRIAFMYKFGRAKLKDLVSLLGGRDFETREYKAQIAEESFAKLSEGVIDFMNQYTFSNFILGMKAAGFISNKLINSQMTMDFAYTLYLLLNNDTTIEKSQIKHYVAKWFVMSTLTSRYTGSPESQMDFDIKRIREKGFLAFFQEVEEANLSDTFWNVRLVQQLETQVINSPFFNVFLAAQIYEGNNALFSNGTKVGYLITLMGEVHHIFPKQYLRNNGFNERIQYNQIANFTYLDTQVNKDISDAAPNVYFTNAIKQCEEGNARYGNITDLNCLKTNMAENCIPEQIVDMDYSDYPDFLIARRKLMAAKIKDYYFSL